VRLASSLGRRGAGLGRCAASPLLQVRSAGAYGGGSGAYDRSQSSGGGGGGGGPLRRRPDDYIARVKEAAVLSEVIASTGLELIPSGPTFKARCPFHKGGEERTPSLSIDDRTGYWKCFSCQEGGDVFRFLMLSEGMEFREALAAVAAQYGVERSPAPAGSGPAPAWRRPSEAGAVAGRGGGAAGAASAPAPAGEAGGAGAERLLEALDAAAEVYEVSLRDRSAAQCAAMLRRRGIRAKTCSLFRLGYAPSRPSDSATAALRARGFTEEELLAAGMRQPRDGREMGEV